MVSETPATARLSHVGHRRAPSLSNQIAGKDRQTCPGLGGSGLPLPMSWEVTGIRTCLRASACSSRARHTYLHSLGAHAAPRAAPPKETRPGPAGAAAAGRQRRRALGHLARQVAAAARRALAPHSPRARGLRGRQKRAPGAALPPCALGGGCSGAPRGGGPGGAGRERGGGGAVRCPGLRGARGGCRLRAQRVPAAPLPRYGGSSSDARCPLPGDNFSEVGARAAALAAAGVVSRRAEAAATAAVVVTGDTGKLAGGVRTAWS